MKKINLTFAFVLALIILHSCKKDPKPQDAPNNDLELITTVELNFEDTLNGTKSKFIFKDLDGEGGNAPSSFDTIKLESNKVYKCSIKLYDETKSPKKNVGEEVLKEADEHLFVFESNSSGLIFTIIDKDKNNLPLGLESLWKTGAANKNTVNIKLKHQPDGIKDGTPIKGESDIDLNFQIEIN